MQMEIALAQELCHGEQLESLMATRDAATHDVRAEQENLADRVGQRLGIEDSAAASASALDLDRDSSAFRSGFRDGKPKVCSAVELELGHWENELRRLRPQEHRPRPW